MRLIIIIRGRVERSDVNPTPGAYCSEGYQLHQLFISLYTHYNRSGRHVTPFTDSCMDDPPAPLILDLAERDEGPFLAEEPSRSFLNPATVASMKQVCIRLCGLADAARRFFIL